MYSQVYSIDKASSQLEFRDNDVQPKSTCIRVPSRPSGPKRLAVFVRLTKFVGN